jgi:hypothetical protein
VLLALSLAIAAIGCAGAQVYLLTGNDPNRPLDRSRPPATTVTSTFPQVGCYTNFAMGLLMVDATYGTTITDGSIGGTRPVMWPTGYTGRRAGPEVDVLNREGHVVATTGRRYQIEGAFVGKNPASFLACGYVLPK